MNKDLKYSGYTAVPSDYECNDGELCVSLNLICEDSHIKPLPAPVKILGLADRERIIYIHHTSAQDNYIISNISDDDSGPISLSWIKIDESLTSTADAYTLLSFDGTLRSISAIGNVLVLALDSGLNYAVWSEGEYRVISGRPFVSLEFGLTDASRYYYPDSKTIDTPTERSSTGNAVYSDIALTAITNAVLGEYLAIAAEEIDNGRFCMPFFVRYALRLYDGNYICHSAPVLMTPTATVPKITVESSIPTTPQDSLTLKFGLRVDSTILDYRVLCLDSEFELWESLISAIDIFVSAPIYTYDQSADFSNTLTGTWGDVASKLYRNPSSAQSSSSRAASGSASGNVRPGYGASDSDSGFSSDVPDYFFVGRHGAADSYADVSCSKSDSTIVFNIPRNEKFHTQVQSCSQFYRIASIPFSRIATSESFAPVSIEDGSLSNITARPVLPDDYQTNCNISPKSLYVFNSRLNAANVSLALAPPFPIRSLSPAGDINSSSSLVSAKIRVWLKKDGELFLVENPSGFGAQAFDSPFSVISSSTHFPRWIFYPDSSAYKMEIAFSNGESYIFPLISHEFLNGAFWYGSFNVDPRPDSGLTLTDSELNASNIFNRNNAIYTSEVNNPFYFPLTGINTVGTGDILGISSAAKALSQGQFGQFPLYAFTSDGVWAMEVSSTGAFTARQPITRDVCINGDSITQLDSSVLFVTDRGIMLISGSNTQCITDSINSETPFDVSTLSGMNNLHTLVGHEADTCIPTIPFSDFLTECGILYDYVHQHIIVYHPSKTYAYVFSLKSKEWGMMYSNILAGLNSYPDALAVDKDYNLVNFALPTDASQKGLLVTRPLKLDAPDVLKTIDTVIQRGNFRKGHVQSVLYGSRNLYDWHLVWSSKDHYLRGFRGTPYKYFRIALLCNLSPDESVFSASLRYTPKLNNQLR